MAVSQRRRKASARRPSVGFITHVGRDTAHTTAEAMRRRPAVALAALCLAWALQTCMADDKGEGGEGGLGSAACLAEASADGRRCILGLEGAVGAGGSSSSSSSSSFYTEEGQAEKEAKAALPRWQPMPEQHLDLLNSACTIPRTDSTSWRRLSEKAAPAQPMIIVKAQDNRLFQRVTEKAELLRKYGSTTGTPLPPPLGSWGRVTGWWAGRPPAPLPLPSLLQRLRS